MTRDTTLGVLVAQNMASPILVSAISSVREMDLAPLLGSAGNIATLLILLPVPESRASILRRTTRGRRLLHGVRIELPSDHIRLLILITPSTQIEHCTIDHTVQMASAIGVWRREKTEDRKANRTRETRPCFAEQGKVGAEAPNTSKR